MVKHKNYICQIHNNFIVQKPFRFCSNENFSARVDPIWIDAALIWKVRVEQLIVEDFKWVCCVLDLAFLELECSCDGLACEDACVVLAVLDCLEGDIVNTAVEVERHETKMK